MIKTIIIIISVLKCINNSIEQKRKKAVQAASNLTQALVDHLNVG